MKIQIRKSVFETNSSSTHSLCIARTESYELPTEVNFTIGEFGWEYAHYFDTHSKAQYLYTGILENKMFDLIDCIKEILSNNNVKYTFQEPILSDEGWLENGYIDHSSELIETLTDICSNEKKLLSYLFCQSSFVTTGNDNSEECDVEPHVDNEYYFQYYKGN